VGSEEGGSAVLFPGEEGTSGRRALEAVAAAFGWLRPGEDGSRTGPMWQ
jgi:hypothetical protein